MSRITLEPPLAKYLDQKVLEPLLLKAIPEELREAVVGLRDKIKASGGKNSSGEVIFGGAQAALAAVLLGQKIFTELDQDSFLTTPGFTHHYRAFLRFADQVPGRADNPRFYLDEKNFQSITSLASDVTTLAEQVYLLGESFISKENNSVFSFHYDALKNIQFSAEQHKEERHKVECEKDFFLTILDYAIRVHTSFHSSNPLSDVKRLYEMKALVQEKGILTKLEHLKTALDLIEYYQRNNKLSDKDFFTIFNLQLKINFIYQHPNQVIFFPIQKEIEIADYLSNRFNETEKAGKPQPRYAQAALNRYLIAIDRLKDFLVSHAKDKNLADSLAHCYKKMRALFKAVNQPHAIHKWNLETLAYRNTIQLGGPAIIELLDDIIAYEEKYNSMWSAADWKLTQLLMEVYNLGELTEKDLEKFLEKYFPGQGYQTQKLLLESAAARINQNKGFLGFLPDDYLTRKLQRLIGAQRGIKRIRAAESPLYQAIRDSGFTAEDLTVYKIYEKGETTFRAFFHEGDCLVNLWYNPLHGHIKIYAAQQEKHSLTAIPLNEENFLNNEWTTFLINLVTSFETFEKNRNSSNSANTRWIKSIDIISGSQVRLARRFESHLEFYTVRRGSKEFPLMDEFGNLDELKEKNSLKNRFEDFLFPSVGSIRGSEWVNQDVFNFEWNWEGRSFPIQAQLFHQRTEENITLHVIVDPTFPLRYGESESLIQSLAKDIQHLIQTLNKKGNSNPFNSIQTLTLEIDRALYIFDRSQEEYIFNGKNILRRPSQWISTQDKDLTHLDNVIRMMNHCSPSLKDISFTVREAAIPQKIDLTSDLSGQNFSSPADLAKLALALKMQTNLFDEDEEKSSIPSNQTDSNFSIDLGWEALIEDLVQGNIVFEIKENIPPNFFNWINVGHINLNDAGEPIVEPLTPETLLETAQRMAQFHDLSTVVNKFMAPLWLAVSSGDFTVYFYADQDAVFGNRFQFIKMIPTNEALTLPALNDDAPRIKNLRVPSRRKNPLTPLVERARGDYIHTWYDRKGTTPLNDLSKPTGPIASPTLGSFISQTYGGNSSAANLTSYPPKLIRSMARFQKPAFKITTPFSRK